MLIVPLDAANNFVMAARLELFITSTVVKPANGVELACAVGEVEDENELETPLIVGADEEVV